MANGKSSILSIKTSIEKRDFQLVCLLTRGYIGKPGNIEATFYVRNLSSSNPVRICRSGSLMLGVMHTCLVRIIS